MDIQKLEEILQQSESEKLDFKLEFSLEHESNKKEFVKDVTAIANSKGGRGYIVFGIKDKTKEVVGVTTQVYDEERVQQIICSRCDPPVPARLAELFYEGKKIVVLTIFKSDQRPHQIIKTGTFYIRRGSTTDIARRHEIAGMLQENGILCYETTLITRGFLYDLDASLLEKHILNGNDINSNYGINMLEGLGFIGRDTERSEYHPTAGGMLLFGKHPQSFLPSTGIRLEHCNNVNLIEGNIPSMLEQAEQLLFNILKDTNYPIQAIYESLYNAIVHRDYWDSTREIVLILTDKKIEIINPGAIWHKEGAVKFDNDTNPPRRNTWLYQRLLILDKKQRFLNSPIGIRTVKTSFENYENPVKFVNLTKKNLFKVVLPGIKDIK